MRRICAVILLSACVLQSLAGCAPAEEPPAPAAATAVPTQTPLPQGKRTSAEDMEEAPAPQGKRTAGAAPAPAGAAGGEFTEVDSSAFLYVAYFPETEELGLVFRSHPEDLYMYSDFSREDWDAFWNADSLGRHFNSYIKDRYDYTKSDFDG